VWCWFSPSPLASKSTYAQQKKGDKEVQAFASGFHFQWGGDFKPRTLDPNSSGSFNSSSYYQNFSLGGALGYFLTRKHEIGAGVGLFVSRSHSCSTFYTAGEIIGTTCGSYSHASLGLSGFYRYHLAKRDAKGFPFVGASIGVSDVTINYTGNVTARPHVGYKYFVKRNVALDFSVGYLVELNKVDDARSVFIRDRINSVDGQLGLSFVF
jgi:hypothetical protein